MKKLFTAVIMILLAVLNTTAVMAQTTMKENIELVSKSYHEPFDITYLEDEKAIILKCNSDVKEICVNIQDLYLEPMHFYTDEGNEFKIDVSAVGDGEHIVYVSCIFKNGNRYNTFNDNVTGYSFTTGKSNFAKYGVKNDNIDTIENSEKYIETINAMFEIYPILNGTIDEILIEDDNYFTENGGSLAYTKKDAIISLKDGGKCLAATIKINPQLATPQNLENSIIHEMVHVLMADLAIKNECGLDVHNITNCSIAYMCLETISNTDYERKLRNEILLKNGYSLNDVETDIREYAISSHAEFFTNAIAQALTNPAPSKLSKIVFEELEKIK